MADERRSIDLFINNKVAQNKSLADLRKELRTVNNALARNKRATKEQREEFVRGTIQARKLTEAIRQQRQSIRGTTSAFQRAKGVILGVFGGNLLFSAANAISKAIRGAAQSIGRFSKASAQLQAITGVSDEQLGDLQSTARDLAGSLTEDGFRITQSASEILEAFKLVGSAKPELLQNAAALEETTVQSIKLSKAAGIDLESAVRATTNSLNQYGESADKAAEFVDVLAAGSKFGAGDVEFLNEAIKNSGTVANAAGLEFSENVAFLELFAEKGLQAGEAGTKLRNVLLILQKDQSNYTDGIFDVNKALDNLAERQDDTIDLLDEFGKQNVSAAQIVAQNVDRYKELAEQLEQVGVANEQAQINTSTLGERFTALTSRWESFVLSLEDGNGKISRIFGNLITVADDYLRILTDLNRSEEEREAKRKGDIERIRLLNAQKTAIADLNEAIRVGIKNQGESFERERFIASFLRTEIGFRERAIQNEDELRRKELDERIKGIVSAYGLENNLSKELRQELGLLNQQRNAGGGGGGNTNPETPTNAGLSEAQKAREDYLKRIEELASEEKRIEAEQAEIRAEQRIQGQLAIISDLEERNAKEKELRDARAIQEADDRQKELDAQKLQLEKELELIGLDAEEKLAAQQQIDDSFKALATENEQILADELLAIKTRFNEKQSELDQERIEEAKRVSDAIADARKRELDAEQNLQESKANFIESSKDKILNSIFDTERGRKAAFIISKLIAAAEIKLAYLKERALLRVALAAAKAPPVNPVAIANITASLAAARINQQAALLELAASTIAGIPGFQDGTKFLTERGPILVGEIGRELAITPDGRLKILGAQGPEVGTLPFGTEILNNAETERRLSNSSRQLGESVNSPSVGPSPFALESNASDIELMKILSSINEALTNSRNPFDDSITLEARIDYRRSTEARDRFERAQSKFSIS